MPSFKDSTSIVFLHPPSPFCFLSAIGHSWVGSLSCGWHSSLLTGLATSILSPKSHSLHRHQSGIPETPFHFNHLSLSPVSRWAHQTACFFLSTPGVQGDLKAQGQCHLHESSPCLPTLWDLSELAIFFFFFLYLYYNISSLSLESETILCKFSSPAKLLLQQIFTEYLSHMWPYAKLWRYSWVSKNEAYSTAPEILLAIVWPPIPGTVLCTW